MRLSFVGELGWELHIPKDACLPVYHAVMAAGAKHGIINSGYRAIDSLSIEKGRLKGETQPVLGLVGVKVQPFPHCLQGTGTGTPTSDRTTPRWRRG